MSEGFQLFDIILFAMIAGFIVLRLRKVLGRRSGQQRRPADQLTRRRRAEQGKDNIIELPERVGAAADVDFEAESADEAESGDAAEDPLAAGLDRIETADASFDRVLSSLVLDHTADLASFFRECRRICRPDGFIVVSTMHPAMMLRGIMAHFSDPTTGRDILPQSYTHQVSDYVLAVQEAGLRFEQLSEHIVNDELAARSPRAAKYRGWPLLLLMRLRLA